MFHSYKALLCVAFVAALSGASADRQVGWFHYNSLLHRIHPCLYLKKSSFIVNLHFYEYMYLYPRSDILFRRLGTVCDLSTWRVGWSLIESLGGS